MKKIISERDQLASALQELQLHQTELEMQNAELRRSEVLLEDVKSQYFDLYELAPVGYCTISRLGEILQANLTLTTMLGVARGTLLSQRLSRFVKPEDQDILYRLRANTAGSASCELRLLRADGTIIWALLMATVVATDELQQSEDMQSLRLTFSDVTQRKLSEVASFAAIRAKSAFLGNMSHEVRTPMNGVLGIADVLSQTELTAEQQHMVATIRRSSLSLLQLLNDILDFSQLESGGLDIELVPTSLREIAESVGQLVYVHGDAVDLCVFVSPLLPQWILSDPKRLRQILLNLMGNAIKFRRAMYGQVQHITLMVEPCTLPSGQPGVELVVTDDGIGMSAQTLLTLFQPFTQGDMGTDRKFGGAGLGLTISQGFAAMLGGSIAVKSTLGHGSQFTMYLPLQEVVPEDMPEAQTCVLPQLLGVHVLCVSRSAAAMRVVPGYCEAAGADVFMVPDLVAAREFLAQELGRQQTIVVLLGPDVSVPTEQLQLPAKVAVVRMVARHENAFGSEMQLHANPILQLDLLQAMWVASCQHSLTTPVQESYSVTPTIGIRVLVVEDNPINRFVLDQQLRLLGYAPDMAEDGAVALQMLAAYDYCLVLTDLHMPNMDGFELTRRIREGEASGIHIPIIAVTGDATAGIAEYCLESGMDDYLTKPVELKTLSVIFKKWLPALGIDLSRPIIPRPRTEVQIVMPQSQSEIFPIFDITRIDLLVGNDAAIRDRLLLLFLRDAPGQASMIEVGAVTGDLASVMDVSHTLKTAARMVGGMLLAELCEAIESKAHAKDSTACNELVGGLTRLLSITQQAIQASEDTVVLRESGPIHRT